MAKEVLMPKLGMTMETGTIISWFKNEGDTVTAGEVLLEVMTDKINIEVEAYESGTLLKKYYQEDEVVPVNQVIAYIGSPDEKVPDMPPDLDVVAGKKEEKLTAESERKLETEKKESSIHKPRATPAARKLAREHDIDLNKVQGSGLRGRIHREDVQRYIEVDLRKPEKVTSIIRTEEKIISDDQIRTPITGMRKVIGERMVQSVHEAPHVTLHSELDMTQAVEMRKQLLPIIQEKTGLRISYTEIILKAVAVVLKDDPAINASIIGNEIVSHSEVNIGLAVSQPKGLLVPVIKHVDQLGMAELTKISKQVAKDAREDRLNPDLLQGGTFTVSNLGMYAVDSFTPIINLPETAILGVGRIVEKPVGHHGEILLRPMMSVSLSFDHRAIDGAPAAAFLTQLKEVLENPFQLLV